MILPWWRHWVMLRDGYGCHNKGEGREATGTQWVEPRKWGQNNALDSQISHPPKELELSGPKCQSSYGETLV